MKKAIKRVCWQYNIDVNGGHKVKMEDMSKLKILGF